MHIFLLIFLFEAAWSDSIKKYHTSILHRVQISIIIPFSELRFTLNQALCTAAGLNED